MICIFVILGKGLVSDDAASFVTGVKCFFDHYLSTTTFRRKFDVSQYLKFIIEEPFCVVFQNCSGVEKLYE